MTKGTEDRMPNSLTQKRSSDVFDKYTKAIQLNRVSFSTNIGATILKKIYTSA